MTEAFIFTTTIKVDSTTLVVMLVSAGLGSYIGAGIISKMDDKKSSVNNGNSIICNICVNVPWITLGKYATRWRK